VKGEFMKKLIVIAVVFLLIPALYATETAPKGIKNVSKPHALPPLSTGGPDDFGYEWIDSAEPGGPVFSWVEISETGTNMLMTDDDHYWPIPFTFTFYGTTYDSIAVGSNGTVYFEDWYLGLGNVSLPGYSEYDVDTFIAVYWDDLNPEYEGDVYYQVMGDTLVVEWDAVPLYGYPDSIETFEALLIGSTGDIIMQYLVVEAQGFEATIGIQGSPVQPPLWALEYSYMTPSLYDSLAIKFYIPVGIEEEKTELAQNVGFSVPAICINGKTHIELILPSPTDITLDVYDALGRPLQTLVSERFSAGTHSIPVSVDVPAGVYFYNLKTDISENIVKKVLHVR
jgi:hypothetical protein